MTDKVLHQASKDAVSNLTEGSWGQELVVEGFRLQIQVDKVLMQPVKSPFQEIAVYESKNMGRVLIIDGRVQLTTADEFTYHEMISHVPLFAHGNVKKVLIIGGGDGGVLRELLKHKTVEQATLIDIDEKIIEVSKQWLPTVHAGSLVDPRSRVIVGDGIKFVQETSEKFDVILIDSTDPEEEGPSTVLYRVDFYESCKRCLNPGGILVSQCGHPQFEGYTKVALSHVSAVFKHTTLYPFCVPTYLGGLECLAFATDNDEAFNVPVSELQKRFEAANITNLKHYTPEYHKGVFSLPKWLKELVEDAHRLAEKIKEKK